MADGLSESKWVGTRRRASIVLVSDGEDAFGVRAFTATSFPRPLDPPTADVVHTSFAPSPRPFSSSSYLRHYDLHTSIIQTASISSYYLS